MIRYALIGILLAAAIAVAASVAAPSPYEGPRSAATSGQDTAGVPASVREAAAAGRYWRASRLMSEHLATVSDTAPATILLTARLHAGWDDWEQVVRLLEGRTWLDGVEAGAGWELLGRSRIALGRAASGATALSRYLAFDGRTSRETGVAELRRGLALAEAGDTDQALAAFSRAEAVLPWFSDWASMLAAEAAAAAGDTAAVRVRLAGAGALADDHAWRIRFHAAREAGDSVGAREVALETARSTGSAATRAAAWARVGALRLAAGDTARARTAFLEAMSNPAYMGAIEGARALSELRPSPTEWRRIADIYARHGNAARAADGYARYVEAGIGSEAERYEARLQLGRAQFNAGRHDRAEQGLLELAGEPVPASLGAEALYLAGRAQYRQGRSQEGQRTLALLPERFPGQEAVTRGLFLLADLEHDDLDLEAARRHYRQAADASPSLYEAGLSLMRLGGIAMLEGELEEAARIFEEYRRLHPDGRRWAQSTYWAARAYRGLGRDDEATARLRELRGKDPLSYYGVRAAELLGVPVLDVPMAEAPAAGGGAGPVEAGLRRVDVLAELGRRSALVQEVERLRAELGSSEAGRYALAEALTARGHTLTAIGMGWELFRERGQWNERLLRIVYPFPFQALVLPETRDRGLDPYLVAALIRQESAFNPTVTSGAGAIGLMQVMPETGRALAREAGVRDYDPELLKQPELNVHFGTRYLATMLGRFDHDLPLVLSAYNAGPTRAARWRKLPDARDPELLIERVPYRETRDYIRSVLLNRALYRALYPDLASAEP